MSGVGPSDPRTGNLIRSRVLGGSDCGTYGFTPNPVRDPPYSWPDWSGHKLNSWVMHPVMAMAVSRNSTLALSVSADHLVGRYDLNVNHHAYALKHVR